MPALKAFVIFLGLLIVAGVALVVYGLAQPMQGGREAGGGFDDTALALPAGCSLVEARLESGRLVLRADGPAERGCQQVILLDPDSGAVLGRVTVAPEP